MIAIGYLSLRGDSPDFLPETPDSADSSGRRQKSSSDLEKINQMLKVCKPYLGSLGHPPERPRNSLAINAKIIMGLWRHEETPNEKSPTV